MTNIELIHHSLENGLWLIMHLPSLIFSLMMYYIVGCLIVTALFIVLMMMFYVTKWVFRWTDMFITWLASL